MAAITGRVVPPHNQAVMASVTFQPSNFLSVLPERDPHNENSITYTLINGSLPEGADVPAGDYDVFVRMFTGVEPSGCPVDVHIGSITVGSASSYSLADLL